MARSGADALFGSAAGFSAARGLAVAVRALVMGVALAACGVERVELRPVDSAAPDMGAGSEEDTDMSPAESMQPSNGAGGNFDVGTEPNEEMGCSKVDFLFVVDNSISMFQEQENLSRSFPRFLSVVEQSVEANDFHIMVVDTDGWDGEVAEEGDTDPCNDELGAGKRSGAIGQSCGVEGSARYLDGGQSSLPETFSCIAQVGTFGDSAEQPMDAMLQATSAAKNGAGGCNEGFLRDDAILVVTFITDDDDDSSSGNPATWRQALLDAKHDDEGAVVVLGLVGDNNLDVALPGGPCGFLSASGAPSLQSFVESFAHGSLASVCAEDYAPFFEAAVRNIDTACDAFVPPVIQ